MMKIIAITLLSASTFLSLSAFADSPEVFASGKQCKAKWHSGPGAFSIWDLDHHDNDYCYVEYGFEEGELIEKQPLPQDSSEHGPYPINTGCSAVIYWRVCKAREDDNDICSQIQNTYVE